ncbi:hypothetical protein [Spiroplasma sp. SV19]|uniref:hypothetical protein n=1 Tax=Spiroplasma sp. SV19 TaxID=2570468 RepID=UPI0024B83CB6|nr:hypothetical protein [Spiroplasma sp. SV19]WHQ36400.1 hypothetical protein E7Y35_00360 [Spiroplasma sp. SV19]
MNNKISITTFFDEIYDETIKNLKKPPKFNASDLYYKIKELSIDARGSFGQRFLVNAFKKSGFKASNDNDKNKDWDIKLENYRVEVKTATLDVNNRFQHEAVHNTANYDLLIFLDIAPNKIFIKGILYSEINFLETHQRGAGRKNATGAGFKYDYSLKKHLEEKNEIVFLDDLKEMIILWKERLDKFNN